MTMKICCNKLHSHDFIEVVYIASGFCVHDWQGTKVRLVPCDVFIIALNETHAFTIEAETVIYNCLFYPAVLGDDWLNLQEDPDLQNLLVLEPLFRKKTGGEGTPVREIDRRANRYGCNPYFPVCESINKGI